MTVNELIALLQALPESERERRVWVEYNMSGGGYALLEEIDGAQSLDGEPVIALVPEAF